MLARQNTVKYEATFAVCRARSAALRRHRTVCCACRGSAVWGDHVYYAWRGSCAAETAHLARPITSQQAAVLNKANYLEGREDRPGLRRRGRTGPSRSEDSSARARDETPSLRRWQTAADRGSTTSTKDTPPSQGEGPQKAQGTHLRYEHGCPRSQQSWWQLRRSAQ